MGAQEALLETGRAPLADDVDRNAGGVAADDGAGGRNALDAFHQRLFGAGALHDHLDHPVALLDGAVEVIFQVADADQGGGAFGKEIGRIGLDHAVIAGLYDAVAHLAVGQGQAGGLLRGRQLCGHDVQQRAADARVGQMPGNRRAHGPRADHGDVLNSIRHEYRLLVNEFRILGQIKRRQTVGEHSDPSRENAASGSSLAWGCFERVLGGLEKQCGMWNAEW
jgi:hypothetical protein